MPWPLLLLYLACASQEPEPPPRVYTRITVTASRGTAEDAASTPQLVTVKEAADLLKQPLLTIGNALEGEPGILVQQSTAGQVSPFLRGLTGYQVLNLIDGIRFNNSTFRSGPNQYLAWIEPSQAERVEAMLGPASAQYGSDALGGTIQVLTPAAQFASGAGRQWHGDAMLSGATADLSSNLQARVSLATERLFWLAGFSGGRHNDVRAGGGVDSRNVYRRLFGLDEDAVRLLTGSRQQDSGFAHYGLQGKLSARLSSTRNLSLYYQRGVQSGVRGYKDLLGGLGRLRSDFEPQTLDWFYARYEKRQAGALDTLSATFSLNSQADGSIRQGLKSTGSLTRDWSRVNAFGYSAQATTHRGSRLSAVFGGDAYDERIASTRFIDAAAQRPLYPDNSRYLTTGLFGQAAYDLTPRLRASAGARWTAVRFSTVEDLRYGIPAAAQWFRDTTFHSSLRYQATSFLAFHALAGRGFRAPNLNDLGALGLNDLGYEIPSADAAGAGALLSADAGEAALSQGTRLGALRSESTLNYEAGLRVNTRRLYARVQFFDTELYDPIVRRTLLFDAASVPASLAGLPVTPIAQTAAQRAQDVVAVATALDPRAVKSFVNDGRSRYTGVESLARLALTRRWSLEANYTFLGGRDLNPNRNIRRLPPQMGSATLRYVPSGRRAWFEAQLQLAGAQRRLSGGDRDDERIGASRRRRDVADFFAGSRVQPLVVDGVFTPTGETLRQIQDRVLPLGAAINGLTVSGDDTRVPLYTSTAGWAALHLRAGLPLGERWLLITALENALDRNYRFHGSGIDAPGLSAYLAIRWSF